MNENSSIESTIIRCSCHSPDHMFNFILDHESGEIWLEVQLSPTRGFFGRCWAAIKYVFGYQSRYGHWDTTDINDKALDQMIELCEDAKKARK